MTSTGLKSEIVDVISISVTEIRSRKNGTDNISCWCKPIVDLKRGDLKRFPLYWWWFHFRDVTKKYSQDKMKNKMTSMKIYKIKFIYINNKSKHIFMKTTLNWAISSHWPSLAVAEKEIWRNNFKILWLQLFTIILKKSNKANKRKKDRHFLSKRTSFSISILFWNDLNLRWSCTTAKCSYLLNTFSFHYSFNHISLIPFNPAKPWIIASRKSILIWAPFLIYISFKYVQYMESEIHKNWTVFMFMNKDLFLLLKQLR